jgi:hypothetical protein
MAILGWHSLVFLIPLALGFVLLLGSAFGLHEFGADADADAAEHDADAPAASVLALLGVGRVPLSLLLMTALFSFGGVGLIAIELCSSLLGDTAAAVAGVGLGLLAAPVAMRLMSRAISRFMPATETYAAPLEALIGSVGTAELEIGAGFGIASVLDAGGAQLKVRCRTDCGRIDKGQRVLLVQYDELTSEFVVEPSPI